MGRRPRVGGLFSLEGTRCCDIASRAFHQEYYVRGHYFLYAAQTDAADKFKSRQITLTRVCVCVG